MPTRFQPVDFGIPARFGRVISEPAPPTRFMALGLWLAAVAIAVAPIALLRWAARRWPQHLQLHDHDREIEE